MAPLPPTRERPVTPAVRPDRATPLAGGPGGPRKPPGRSRGRRIARAFGLAFIILLAVVVGAFAAVAFVANKEIKALTTAKTQDGRRVQKILEKPLPGKPANILVLGSDHREGDGANDRRSDTMLLIRLDPKGKTISMLSVPRDLYVNIPGHGESKINDAYSLGGSKLAVETLQELTGLKVNFVMNVDFQGFRGVVDALDGVWIDVDHHYFNEHDGTEAHNYAEIDIEPGYQRLDGRDALSFARYRHGDSDFARIARQQQTLAAIKQQVSVSSVASNIPGLLDVLNKNVEIVGGGDGKGVPTRLVIDYMRLALKLDSKDIYQVEITGDLGRAGEQSIVVANESVINGAVEAFLRPDKHAQTKTVDQVTGQKTDLPDRAAASPAPPPADTTVTVLNGGGVDGAASGMTEQLRGIGYEVVLPDEAQAAEFPNLANTVVQYRRPASKAAAEALAARIDGASAVKTDGANSFDTQILVVVGKLGTSAVGDDGDAASTTGSTGTEYEANEVPDKAAPQVTTDPEYGREDFEALGKVGFPLLYPTVRESTSTYEEPRAYSIRKGKKGKYRAYRIVAQTGSSAYWGVQGTNWPDPPALESPTRELERGGRTYMLFFVGTKLQKVAWRVGGGTYWVSNSVLGELSNETMLAIAEGVKPL